MHNTLKQLKRIAHEVRLTHDEKSAMREILVRFTATHPAVHPAVKYGDSVLSPYSLLGMMRNFKTMTLISLGGLVVSGSVAFAAEGALPGDMLYTVKTEVNERVRGMATLTARSKAAWEVRLVERRLEEIEKLATRPLSSEAKEATQKNLERYTERVNDRVVSFENKKDIASAGATTEQLMKVLRAHEVAAEGLRRKMSIPPSLPSAATSSVISGEVVPRVQEIIDTKEKEDEKVNRLVPQKQGVPERFEKSGGERNERSLW